MSTPSTAASARLALHGISKRYASVIANDGIDLAVAAGEIHALLGENGAGKSTLMKIVYGVTQPDAGSIEWEGVRVAIRSPAQARRLGIGMVFQRFSIFETLTVAENIALALNERPPAATLAARIDEVSRRYGLPASVLTPQAVRVLFETLRRLAAEGVSILYISHKLDEIRELSDVATIVRNGRVSGSAIPRQHSNTSPARMMVGADLKECTLEPRQPGPIRNLLNQPASLGRSFIPVTERSR
jgi:general nucleoside transport system ATP-binding protein